MNKDKNSQLSFLPIHQTKLFYYDEYFNFFSDLYKKKLLPNKILLTGQSGIGKSTFAYHFINFIMSEGQDFSYDYNKFAINPLNKAFCLVNQLMHPNFFLVDNLVNKKNIDVKQVRNMINYANSTSFEKEIKFIKIDNAEYLNKHSLNALLKIIEEPNPGTYFFIIHNSSVQIAETLKSRCIEFKISFSNQFKQNILNNLTEFHNIELENKILDEIYNPHNSPGNTLNLIKLIQNFSINAENFNLKKLIGRLMELNLKNKNNINLNSLQNAVELFFLKEIRKSKNKSRILLNYSKSINNFNLLKKYNIDMNNMFYCIKENIIHG